MAIFSTSNGDSKEKIQTINLLFLDKGSEKDSLCSILYHRPWCFSEELTFTEKDMLGFKVLYYIVTSSFYILIIIVHQCTVKNFGVGSHHCQVYSATCSSTQLKWTSVHQTEDP